jgi:hypothetical protein
MPRISRLKPDEVLLSAVTIYDRYLRDRGNVPNHVSNYGTSIRDLCSFGGGAKYRDTHEGAEKLFCADVATQSHTILPGWLRQALASQQPLNCYG